VLIGTSRWVIRTAIVGTRGGVGRGSRGIIREKIRSLSARGGFRAGVATVLGLLFLQEVLELLVEILVSAGVGSLHAFGGFAESIIEGEGRLGAMAKETLREASPESRIVAVKVAAIVRKSLFAGARARSTVAVFVVVGRIADARSTRRTGLAGGTARITGIIPTVDDFHRLAVRGRVRGLHDFDGHRHLRGSRLPSGRDLCSVVNGPNFLLVVFLVLVVAMIVGGDGLVRGLPGILMMDGAGDLLWRGSVVGRSRGISGGRESGLPIPGGSLSSLATGRVILFGVCRDGARRHDDDGGPTCPDQKAIAVIGHRVVLLREFLAGRQLERVKNAIASSTIPLPLDLR
jgi:hypothetical protein